MEMTLAWRAEGILPPRKSPVANYAGTHAGFWLSYGAPCYIYVTFSKG